MNDPQLCTADDTRAASISRQAHCEVHTAAESAARFLLSHYWSDYDPHWTKGIDALKRAAEAAGLTVIAPDSPDARAQLVDLAARMGLRVTDDVPAPVADYVYRGTER